MAGFASCDPRCGAGRRDGAPVAQGARRKAQGVRREACEGRGRRTNAKLAKGVRLGVLVWGLRWAGLATIK